MVAEVSVHVQRDDELLRKALVEERLSHWVLLVDPPLENQYPGVRVVARIYDKYEGDLINRGAAGADTWWLKHGAKVEARPWVYAWIPMNEYNGDPRLGNAYLARWCDLAHAKGLRVVGPNFSVGCPEAKDMIYYAESIRKVDYVGFHIYWVPAHWGKPENWEYWLVYRYRWLMEALPPDCQGKPILITEAGADGRTLPSLGKKAEPWGWLTYYRGQREAYVQDLLRLQAELSKDPRVQAVFLFTAGPWHEWVDFYVDVVLLRLATVNNPRGGNAPSPPAPIWGPLDPTKEAATPQKIRWWTEEAIRRLKAAGVSEMTEGLKILLALVDTQVGLMYRWEQGGK